ncbi:MAG: hypothetical protein M9962_00680 [Oligoflexia bacterium]|nr:hypothetical protein [Oligoflexia bacterium]
MKFASTFIGFILLISSAQAGVSDRANLIQSSLFGGRMDINAAAKPGVAGLRNLKMALPGVLYRAGGPGGKVELKRSTLENLCKEGFSLAVYLYDENFSGTQTVNCTTKFGTQNTLRYENMDYLSESGKRKLMREVQNVIENSSKGPIVVHCWNGYHASGEIAANALVQFCRNWTPSSASTYWKANQNGSPGLKRLLKFQGFSEIGISSELERALCPSAP